MKSVLIYLALVVIPVAGVIGVLRVGRNITPPPYVGGTWAVTIRSDSTCHSPTLTDSVTMAVSQSGPHVAISFADSNLPKLRGRAYGRFFRVAGTSDKVHMHGSMKRGENRMRGFLVGVPCEAARRTLLQGTRVAAPGAIDVH